MTSPAVRTNQIDGGLGIRPGNTGRMFAILAPSSAGDTDYLNTPVALARSADIIAGVGYGKAPEFACYNVEHYGTSVLIVKVSASTAGSAGDLDTTAWTGSSAVTIDTGVTPLDDYEYRLRAASDGTIGTAGITLQWSIDAGRNWSPITALGTANTFTIPNTGIKFNFAAGTVKATEYVHGVSTGPVCSESDLTAALDALKRSSHTWEFVVLGSAVTPTVAAALDAWIVAMRAQGKFHWWMGAAELPTPSQSDAQYQTAVKATWAAYATKVASVGAGACRIVSSVPGRSANRVTTPIVAVAPLVLSVSEEVRVSEIDGMALPGVTLTDANGNPAARCHDEMNYPGLDDSGFLVLRTWPDEKGVWVNRPRLMASPGSDYDMIPKIRVWNLFASTLYAFFKKRLQKPVLANPKTGLILESFAVDIEKSANDLANQEIMAKPKASAVAVVLSRKDPLLNVQNPTLTVDGRIQPLGYWDFIDLNLSFAVTVQAAR